ncbi:leucine dehydrogenase [Carboxydocella sporoproducens DSM 16521]|uniref:Leucine dehydrogenase n=2 Tax=Carboxydocella TaxID=178898 RepID=A0A1T4NJG7_9FIRM|nr:leucine dehydrogenase [Carboxydocella thermautotrophica]GAW27861.1 leucine dehydrogenase [Carboxydocella sp. ULO1]GAW32682.1 leucine dehydrogenase [Carboxydocella sp. JDF658]SJZ79177.1 leucine dehydrogenase [Carboxydocella sporoproducens DSM 16521]
MSLEVFEYMKKYDYEQVVLCYDKASGLKAIIAIHDTTLGPALGGTRMWTYASEDDAILDALRLSRGMTYKAAAAGLNLGGGKTVIIGDPRKDKSEALFRAFGRYVESLNGRYITAEDVGTSVQDMEYVRMETRWVTGVASGSGDPSPMTAFGVWKGMKAAAKEKFGTDSLSGMTVAVQGLGHVGYYLCKYLADEGAKLVVTDIFPERVEKVVQEFGARAVEPEAIYGVEAEIFAPCALGAVVNDETLPQFKFQIIAGAANNVLKEERHGDELEAKGILYAPDFVINAGGLINVADELEGYNRERAIQKIAGIYDNILRVFAIAKRDNIPTYKAAEVMAEERIRTIGQVRNNFLRK